MAKLQNKSLTLWEMREKLLYLVGKGIIQTNCKEYDEESTLCSDGTARSWCYDLL